MTRRRRRASSDPQRVGSEEGLTSSRAVADDPTADGPTADGPADDPGAGDASQPVSEEGPGEAADGAPRVGGRHTGGKVEQTKDDTDEGWGEPGDDDASARWLRENRPPHWD